MPRLVAMPHQMPRPVRSSKFLRQSLAVAAMSLVVSAAAAQSAAPPAASGLRTAKLTAGLHVITAEIADNDPARMRGLMFRTSLAPNHGMFFIFEGKSVQCMWMRNVPIGLSVAFIDDDGSIVNIEEMQPQTEVSHCAKRPVRYALEMEKGWFAKRGIKEGMKLTGVGQKPPAK